MVKQNKRRSKKDQNLIYEDIQEKRDRLITDIEEFQHQAPHFLEIKDSYTLQNQKSARNTEKALMSDDEDDGDAELDETDIDEDDEKVMEPENIVLSMPSTMDFKDSVGKGMQALIDKEIMLRTAQANDALSLIRAEIGEKTFLLMQVNTLSLIRAFVGEKTFLLSESHRNQKTTKITSRSSAALRAVHKRINQHVQRYELAFEALTCLNASQNFQPIIKDDLAILKDISEPNRIGQSSDTVSWIWRTGVPSESEAKAEWLEDGKHCLIIKPSLDI